MDFPPQMSLIQALVKHNYAAARHILGDDDVASLRQRRQEITAVFEQGSALHYAVKDLATPPDIVERLAAVPELLETVDACGMTPLHVAAHLCLRHVAVLLRRGADISRQDAAGRTPLDHLMEYCHTTQLRQSMDGGNWSYSNTTILMVLASFNLDRAYSTPESQLAVMRDLLACSKDCAALLASCDNRGETALHKAALYGLHWLVPELLARGADRDARNHGGLTPLYLALDSEENAYLGMTHTTEIKSMLEALMTEDNIEMADFQHNIPPLVAAIHGRFSTETVLKLCTPATLHWPSIPPLYFAVNNGLWSLVPLLLELGADPCEEYQLQLYGTERPIGPLLKMFKVEGLLHPPPLWVFTFLVTPEIVRHAERDASTHRLILKYALHKQRWDVAELLTRAG